MMTSLLTYDDRMMCIIQIHDELPLAVKKERTIELWDDFLNNRYSCTGRKAQGVKRGNCCATLKTHKKIVRPQ